VVNAIEMPRLLTSALRWSSAALVALAALTAARGSSRAAMDDAEKARRAAVVARVGDRAVTAGELEDRLAAVPRFQLAAFGRTAEEIRRAFLNDVIVPEVLLARGAEERKLLADPLVEHQVERALSGATLRVERGKGGRAADVTMDEVRAYYDAHRAQYDAPERLQIWRILCRSRDEALAVLDAARKDGTPAKFNALAREHSADKATAMRGGNLGLLNPDGASNEAGLRVDPAIVKAAKGVKDGELVATPIAEGANFAVIWRRGSVPPLAHTIEEVKDQIRDVLFKQKSEQAQKKLIDALVARELKDFHPELVAAIELPSEVDAISRRRAGGPPLGSVRLSPSSPPK
jgi:peptidyl-prolyl cis-trans isomerase C